MIETLYAIATWLIPLVIAIVFHEVSHGFVAHWLGDPTAKEQGRLNFNPVRHADPVGTVVLPLVLAIAQAPIFGWAKPVPVESRRLRNPRIDMMIVAIAGPAMNLFLGALATLGLAALVASIGDEAPGMVASFVAANLVNFLMINIFLAIFNLIPLPPFDGGHVVEGLLPRSVAPKFAALGRFGFPILLILIVVLPAISPQADIIDQAVRPIANYVARGFLGSVGLAE